jgi:hypothetical protein
VYFVAMATVVGTYQVDDLDGTSGDDVETIQFNAGGVDFEIDLSAKNAKRFRRELAMFVKAARTVDRRTSALPVAKPVGATDRERSRAIRQWAAETGLTVRSHGRLSADVINKFNAAH